MTATAALPFSTPSGRIAHASADRQGTQTTSVAEAATPSFATVLTGTADKTSQPAEAPQAAAATAVSAQTHLSKRVAAATGEVEATFNVEADTSAVATDVSQAVPAATTSTTVTTTVTADAPNLAGTALVVDAEAGDAATPDGEAAELANTEPTQTAGTMTGTVVPGTATGAAAGGVATTTAAAITSATTAAAPQPGAAVAEPAMSPDGAETADTDTAPTSTSSSTAANGQVPSKASASNTVASAAGAGNAGAASSAIMTAAPDLQVATDPAAGSQGKPAATIDAAMAATTTPQDSARASATNMTAQAAAPPATVQVYTRMIERFDGRAQRFEIRLDPAELGRVDVRIEVGADKKVHAVLAAHDSAALNDLMRGHRALERALVDAGIDLAEGGVKFELANDSNRNASKGEGDNRSPAAPNVWRSFETANPSAEAAAKPVAQPWRLSRIDLVA